MKKAIKLHHQLGHTSKDELLQDSGCDDTGFLNISMRSFHQMTRMTPIKCNTMPS